MAFKVGQTLEEDVAGFVVYLAGTDFKTISTQVIGHSYSGVGQETGTGVYVGTGGSGNTLADRVRDNMRARDNGPNVLNRFVWQEFEEFDGGSDGSEICTCCSLGAKIKLSLEQGKLVFNYLNSVS